MNLDELAKEQLISVIANMHDTIQTWNDGYGLSKNESDILIKVGNYACAYCVLNDKWREMTNIKTP